MTFKYLYEVFSNDWILFGIILVVVLSLYFASSDEKRSSNERYLGGDQNTYTACSSPECVRCQKYSVIRGEAPDRLAAYAECNGWSGLGRLEQALHTDNVCLADECPDDLNIQNPNVLLLPDIPSIPVWPGHEFQDVQESLESNFDIVTTEFNKAFEAIENWSPFHSEINEFPSQSGWQINTTPTGCWSVFHLYNQGNRIEQNCKTCPEIALLLESLPGFMQNCLFGNACISVIYPGTVITGHYGPCNVRIRCHLGLRVADGCHLRVGYELQGWSGGDCLFFDDSFWHSAEHLGEESSGPRAVLIVDLWHPDITELEQRAISAVF